MEKAVLYMDGIKKFVTVTQHTFSEVIDVVKRVRETMSSPDPPKVQGVESRCSYCRYKRFCPVP